MKTSTVEVETTEPEVADLEDVTCYEDDDATVICDRTNPKAWIRSDAVAAIDP